MTGLSVKRQTHHLCGQILECGDVEGSQNTAEIGGKRLAIKTCHTAPAGVGLDIVEWVQARIMIVSGKLC
jgi:hypothetical protein